MTCKSHDIYSRISEIMSRKLDIEEKEKYSKEEVLSEYLNALLEYTYCKMIEMGISKKEKFDDFEIMLEKFSDKFDNEQEKEFFYQQFGHSMLNLIAGVEGVGGIIWWSEDRKEGVKYPHFSKKEIMRGNRKRTYVDFHTSKDATTKDMVIWLYKYLSDEYRKGMQYAKKETI